MSNDLKKLVELPEHLRELLSELPDNVADKCLEDTHKFTVVVETITEAYEGLGFDEHELKPMIISSLVQHYDPEE